jgi:pimeloyl-ACP methyl ester carboxylesterase
LRVTPVRQRIRFCNSPDGVGIAYSVIGRGSPLVMLSGGHSHLEFDLESPVLGHWISELALDHSLVRLDTRGFGLSDRNVADQSIDAVASDVRAVTEALGLERSSPGSAARPSRSPSRAAIPAP